MKISEYWIFYFHLYTLVQNAPLQTKGFLFNPKGNHDEQAAKTTYEQYCHGCHSVTITNTNIENPAYSLKEMAKVIPLQEFFARMLLGVKDTPAIGLSNPLTVTEIGAMTRFLLLE